MSNVHWMSAHRHLESDPDDKTGSRVSTRHSRDVIAFSVHSLLPSQSTASLLLYPAIAYDISFYKYLNVVCFAVFALQ